MKNVLISAAVAALALAAGTASASFIPPHVSTVVTHCGQVSAVYVTSKTGFQRFEGPVAIEMSRKVPFNLYVESGCGK